MGWTIDLARAYPEGRELSITSEPLFGRQLDHRLLLTWPDEAVFLKAPQYQPEASALVIQQLDPVTSAVVERKHGMGKWIELHELFDQHHQAVDAAPEGNLLPMQEDLQVSLEANISKLPVPQSSRSRVRHRIPSIRTRASRRWANGPTAVPTVPGVAKDATALVPE
jgi:hypothetical protein